MKTTLFFALIAFALSEAPAYKVTTTIKIGGEGYEGEGPVCQRA